MGEYLIYPDLQHLSLEALSFNKKSITAIFRHNINKKIAIGIKYNRTNGTASVSYPKGVSAAHIVLHDLELCMRKVSENLEKQMEVGNAKI